MRVGCDDIADVERNVVWNEAYREEESGSVGDVVAKAFIF